MGSWVIALDPMVIREGEDLHSREIGQLAKSQVMQILQHGSGETGRRVLVRTEGVQGWISVVAKSGRPLLGRQAGERQASETSGRREASQNGKGSGKNPYASEIQQDISRHNSSFRRDDSSGGAPPMPAWGSLPTQPGLPQAPTATMASYGPMLSSIDRRTGQAAAKPRDMNGNSLSAAVGYASQASYAAPVQTYSSGPPVQSYHSGSPKFTAAELKSLAAVSIASYPMVPVPSCETQSHNNNVASPRPPKIRSQAAPASTALALVPEPTHASGARSNPNFAAAPAGTRSNPNPSAAPVVQGCASVYDTRKAMPVDSYPVGARVVTLDAVVLRQFEELKSTRIADVK